MNNLRHFILLCLLTTQACIHAQQTKLGGTAGLGGTSGVQNPNSRLVITTNSLPDATASVTYSQTLTQNNGTAPLTWTVFVGTLPPGLVLNSSSGAITGTPTAVGNYPFTILLTDSTTPTAKTATKDLSISVTCGSTLQITSQSPLPLATVGSPDNYQFLSVGGLATITWTVGTGLPTGTALSSGGALSGNPTVAGLFSFNITATDSCPTPQVVTVPFTQQVNNGLTITTLPTLPNGTRGSPYSAQVSASGGTSPYTFSLLSGTPPTGLTVNANGSITGTPTTAGTFTFFVKVTDNVAATNNAQFTITIDCGATLSITSGATLPIATQGLAYSNQLLSTGGNGTVTWLRTGGTLDPGLSISSTGLLSGTPTSPGTYAPVFKVTDSCTPTAQTDSQAFSLTVGQGLVITTTSLPAGVQGVPYASSVVAQGGVPPYQWTVPSGPFATGAEDLLQGWLLMTLTGRNNFHMSGGSNPTYSVLEGGMFFNIKSPNGNPADIRYYDDTYTYFLYTDNNDAVEQAACIAAGFPSCFADPFAYKQAVNTRPFTPRYFVPGTVITIMTPPVLTGGNVNPGIRTTNCGLDNQPLRYLGNIKTVTSGPTTVAWGGDVGTQPTIEVDYYYSGSSLGVYQDRERFYLVKPFGRVSWDHANWNGSGFTVDQSTLNNMKVAGGAPTPNFGCGIPNLSQAGILPTGVVRTSAPSLNLVDSTGAITGTPNSSGTSQFTIQVEDSVGTITQKTLSLTTTCPAITLNSTSPLPQGTVSQPYNFQFSSTGGASPTNWTILSGTLPNGLLLSSAGVLSGTPTQTGIFNVVVQVLDSCSPNPQSDQKPFTLTIAANSGALTISTSTPLAQATEQSAYSQQLQATGGTPGYTWSLSAGTLPAGITLTPGGLLAGTPTATGVYSFTVRVTDSISGTTTKALSLTVVCPTLLNTSSSPLPPGTVNQPYSFQFTKSGGLGAVTWSATGVPSGLTLSASGLLSGTPVSAATSTINVTVTDSCVPVHQSVGPTAFSLTVNAAIPSVAITSTSPLAQGTEGVAYSNSLSATGGVPPYTWSITVGALQTGLSLSSAGIISGTPTVTSTLTPTFHVVDSLGGNDSKVLSLTVACPAFNVTSSSPLPVATQNQPYSFTFTKTGGAGSVTWTATGVPTGLTLSAGGVLSGTPTGTGVSTINVTATDSCAPTPQAIGPTAYSLTINAAPNPLSINTVSPLPSAVLNQAYSTTITATGGTAPYGSWTVTVGTLPTGLTLHSATGVIDGIPTVTGSSTFTIRVTDNVAATATKSFTLVVAAASTADNRYCNVNETTNFSSPTDGPATLPTRCVRTAIADTPAAGPTKTVCASGCDFTTLQAAVNAASAGWIIQVKALTGTTQNTFAGATISGLHGTATNWIIIETDKTTNLPTEGSRVTPAWIGIPSLLGRPAYSQPSTAGIYLPKIRGGNNLINITNSSFIRFIGLQFTTTTGTSISNIVNVASSDHMIWDRILCNGGDSANWQSRDSIARCFSWTAVTYGAVVDSYIADLHCVAGGACGDAQGILLGGNSASAEGPWKIVNDFWEAAAEPVFSGGGGTGATNTVPHDLEFRRCHTWHPLFWKANDPSYFGTNFVIKNLFEMKNVDRVLMEGFISQQTWEGQADQHGHAVLLAPKNQSSIIGGTASSNGSGTVTKLTGAFAFNSRQVSPNCATPLHCNFTLNGVTYKTQTVIDGTHITVAPSPPVISSAAFKACQEGQNPNAQVTNVTVRFSYVSSSKNGFQLFTGLSDCGDLAAGAGNFSIHDVVLDYIDGQKWVSSPGGFSGNESLPMGQISNDVVAPHNLHDLTIRHVTGLARMTSGSTNGAFGPGIAFTHQGAAGTSIANLKIYDSIFAASLQLDQVGVCGLPSRITNATTALQCVTSVGGTGAASYCFDHNVLATTTATSGAVTTVPSNPPYPTASPNCPFTVNGNRLPASYDAILFTNLNGAIGGNYQLLSTSPYHNTASDNTDPGANIPAVNSAISGVN